MVKREHDTIVRVKIEVPLAVIVAELSTFHRKDAAGLSAMRTDSAMRFEDTHSQTCHTAANVGTLDGHPLLLFVHCSENDGCGVGAVTLVGHAQLYYCPRPLASS